MAKQKYISIYVGRRDSTPEDFKYVGQTIDFERRRKQHFYYARKKPRHTIQHAINSHPDFDFEEIACAFTNEGADWIEKRLIEHFGTYSTGYNETVGGQKGTRGFKWPEEKKLRGAQHPMFGRTGTLCPSFGIKRTDAECLNISKTHKGKVVTEETRNKMRGPNNPQFGKTGTAAKETVDISSGFVFVSATEAAKCFNLNPKYLMDMLSGRRPNKTSLRYLDSF